MKEKLYTLFFLLLIIGSPLSAQTISGLVVAEDEPVIGATLAVKGTATGTITDFNGEFELEVPEDATTIILSYTGYETIELALNGQTYFEIEMKVSEIMLGEVVVTSLGIKREKKALGYAVQDVDASELVESRSTNVVNSLSGRVANIQVSGAAVPGGGSQVTIRGNGSILGNNQPLYVIDGVPMEGDFAQPIDGAGDNNVYGGGISEISPDNIASITVLKGANAAALYGSRAANGVILVTTKDGSGGKKGLTVDYNLNATMEKPFVTPEFQDIYGGGNGYVSWYADGRNGGITDPAALEQFRAAYPTSTTNGTSGVDESWGAPMDGRLVRHWWSGEEVAPLVPVPDTWSNFWETGSTINNNIAISSNYEGGNFRFAFGNTKQQGLMYNNDFSRNNFRFNINHDLTDKLKVRVSSEYIKSGSNNRQQPVLWEPQTWHNRHVDWGLLKDYADYADVHITRSDDSYPYANWQHSFALNRFYEQEVLTDSNEKDRLVGNVTLTYKILEGLSLMARTGTDVWTDTRVSVTRNERVKSGNERTQAFYEDVHRRQETNSDFLLTYNKYFNDDLSLNLQVGAANRTNYFKRNYTGVNDVTINGLYNVANNATTNTNRSRIENKEVNSVYAAASFGYKNFLYVDVTGRNDWSSTLPVRNNSYFYPSVSTSIVLSEVMDLTGSPLSYAKVRASWAQVGNDTDPYRLSQVFTPQDPWNSSTPTFSENRVIANNELRPEKTTGIEFGADLRFLNGRFGVDFSYYNQTTTDQIINISVSKTTGYDSKVINAGKIVNKGIEAALSLALTPSTSEFQWNVGLNYAKNNNQIEELFTDANGNELETIVLHSRRGLSLEARVGEPYGTLVGSAYKRVPDGEFAGQIIFKDGIAEKESALQILGNVTPDWTGGITNSFYFKGFSLNALVDFKMGGDITDESSSTGFQTGIYPLTALGREEGVIGVGVKNIGSEESPVYVANDVVGDTKSVVRRLSVRSVNEGAVYDGSYIKLREVSLSYSLPSRIMDQSGFLSGARISLVGRNLLMLYSNHSQIDPELNIYGGNLQGGLFYVTLPTTRSLGMNLNLTF